MTNLRASSLPSRSSFGVGLHSILLLTFTFLVHPGVGSAESIRRTDPRSRDSDRDGYPDGPHLWLDLPDGKGGTISEYIVGEDFNGNGKYEPLGADGFRGTIDDEGDPRDPRSHPMWEARGFDRDRDGVRDSTEDFHGLDPLDSDTDDDGLSDGEEVFGLGRSFVGGLRYYTNAGNPDSDMDGLPDGLELGLTSGIPDATVSECLFQNPFTTAEGKPCFTPDADSGAAATFTDPRLWDTNGDGRADGVHDRNANGTLDRDGADGIPGTLDDESDAVIGFRIAGAMHSISPQVYYMPAPGGRSMYDPDPPNPLNPPEPKASLRFYWGSTTADFANLQFDPPDVVAVWLGDEVLPPPFTLPHGEAPYLPLRLERLPGPKVTVSMSYSLAGAQAPPPAPQLPWTLFSAGVFKCPIHSLTVVPMYAISGGPGGPHYVQMNTAGIKDLLDIAFGFHANQLGSTRFSQTSPDDLKSYSGGSPLPTNTVNAIHLYFNHTEFALDRSSSYSEAFRFREREFRNLDFTATTGAPSTPIAVQIAGATIDASQLITFDEGGDTVPDVGPDLMPIDEKKKSLVWPPSRTGATPEGILEERILATRQIFSDSIAIKNVSRFIKQEADPYHNSIGLDLVAFPEVINPLAGHGGATLFRNIYESTMMVDTDNDGILEESASPVRVSNANILIPGWWADVKLLEKGRPWLGDRAWLPSRPSNTFDLHRLIKAVAHEVQHYLTLYPPGGAQASSYHVIEDGYDYDGTPILGDLSAYNIIATHPLNSLVMAADGNAFGQHVEGLLGERAARMYFDRLMACPQGPIKSASGDVLHYSGVDFTTPQTFRHLMSASTDHIVDAWDPLTTASGKDASQLSASKLQCGTPGGYSRIIWTDASNPGTEISQMEIAFARPYIDRLIGVMQYLNRYQ